MFFFPVKSKWLFFSLRFYLTHYIIGHEKIYFRDFANLKSKFPHLIMGIKEKKTLDHVDVDMLSAKIISKVRITNIKECFSLKLVKEKSP